MAVFRLAASGNYNSGSTWNQGGAVPTSSDDVILDNAYNLTFISGFNNCKTFNSTGYTGTITWNSGAVLQVFGNCTIGSSTNFGTASSRIIYMASTGTLLCNGTTLAILTINTTNSNDTVTLGDAITVTSVGAGLTLTKGILVTGNFVHSISRFASSNSNVRTLNMTDSTLRIGSNNTDTVLDLATTTNLTITNTNGTGILEFYTDSSNRVRTINFGGASLGTVKITGKSTSTAQWAITGSVTINSSFYINAPNIIRITGGKTITIGPDATLSWTGSAGNLIDISVASGTTNWIITRPSGSKVFDCNYLSLDYSTASQDNTFYAGPNSTNGGHNDANGYWKFTSAPPPFFPKVIFM